MKQFIEAAILMVGSSLALSTLAKSTLVLALGLGVTALAGRKCAALRHAVLAAMFGVLLILPVVSGLAPPFRIVLRTQPARALTAPLPRTRVGPSPAIPGRTGDDRSSPLPLSAFLLLGWI